MHFTDFIAYNLLYYSKKPSKALVLYGPWIRLVYLMIPMIYEKNQVILTNFNAPVLLRYLVYLIAVKVSPNQLG
jgi:hypothetical protein